MYELDKEIAMEEFLRRLEEIGARITRIEQALSKRAQLEEDILDTNAAAEFIGVSKNWLYTLTSQKLIPYYRRGKKLHFKKDELRQWLCTRKILTQEEVDAKAELYCLTKK